jgi:hypothetical protein
MAIDADFLKRRIEVELMHISDARVIAHIKAILIDPKPISLGWDYGSLGQEFPGWKVLDDEEHSGAAIAYCEFGFGPRSPWGLIGPELNMGMDSGWFPNFIDAFLESFASIALPIWRVFRLEADQTRTLLTQEGSWEASWKMVERLRLEYPDSHFGVEHSVLMANSAISKHGPSPD